MAYGNWGAWVYRNHERMVNREDVGVFDENEANLPSGLRIFANIFRNRQENVEDSYPWYKHSHHAVLGDGEVRLCGYKCYPELWVVEGGEVKKIPLPEQVDYDAPFIHGGEITVESKTWTWFFELSENLIDLKLTEPDGTVWTSRCGYCYGAGHMDDDAAKEEVA